MSGETRQPAAIPSASWNRLIVLANRAPVVHTRGRDGSIEETRTASGLVTALEPLIRAHAGVWIAHGAGNGDRAAADHRDAVLLPRTRPEYRLRYVWLDDAEFQGYYCGYANEGLWPLCHDVPVDPVFRAADFAMYRAVNKRFAEAAVQEAAGGSPLVLVQDYHFALAPRLVRRRLASSRIVSFWHIPWPRPRVFRTCPEGRELLDGLLASDVVGLQTSEDCANLLGCVEAMPGATIDRSAGRVHYQGRATAIRPHPVGIDPSAAVLRETPAVSVCRREVRDALGLDGSMRLIVGVDRLDYTKGLAQKVGAVERLLETHPEFRGRVVFAQVAAPSRDCLEAYRATRQELRDIVERVNRRFGTDRWQPLRLLDRHHDAAAIYTLYRAADICFVGSLHDGMNLVAKEFAAARDDERGVLVLSAFAGAAQQLRAALIVNPHDLDAMSEVLAVALEMPAVEQTKRMRLLRTNVQTFTASWWANQLLWEAAAADRQHRPPSRRRDVVFNTVVSPSIPRAANSHAR